MVIHEYGDSAADIVLIQPVDAHDLAAMPGELEMLSELSPARFWLIAVGIENWNRDLSPWQAPAVFGRADFGDGAAQTLARLEGLCVDRTKTYCVGGYSLAGLFALWAAYQTDRFRGVAAASPSLWFPGFSEFMQTHTLQCKTVYLSLGDREEKARNPVLASAGDKVRWASQWLQDQNIICTLEWNEGNHFRDAEIRTAKAFAWVLGRLTEDRSNDIRRMEQ